MEFIKVLCFGPRDKKGYDVLVENITSELSPSLFNFQLAKTDSSIFWGKKTSAVIS